MISFFQTDLDFRDLNHESDDEKIRLMLLSPLVYSSLLLRRDIHVPTKFVTDLGSVPQILWNVVPPISRADGAFVVHDWLYQEGGVTREEADGVLLEAMIARHVKSDRAHTIYYGVRLGGWHAWRKYRKMEKVELEAKGLL